MSNLQNSKLTNIKYSKHNLSKNKSASPSLNIELDKYNIFSNSTFITICGIILITLFAQISIPLNPVPITLHTVAVILIGLVFSSQQALKITTLYLILGMMGLPIFSNFNFGIQKVFGPSGGYMIGFIPAAYFLALVREKLNVQSWFKMALMATIANMIIFLFGVSRLSYFVGFKNAINLGFLPFIIPGVFKIIILISLVKIFKLTQMKK